MKKKKAQFLIALIFKRNVKKFNLYWNLIENEDSFLNTTGWLKSHYAKKPLDKEGNQTVWMNYAVTNFLNQRLNDSMSLFEYGSGYSTRFYAERVKRVVSVEYDEEWAETVAASLPSNAKLVFKTQDVDGVYCRAIHDEDEKFDLVVVDGRDRVNCVKQAESMLTERGVILLDDSERERYSAAFAYLESCGMRALTFEGIKPTGLKIFHTTIFYREKNCVQL